MMDLIAAVLERDKGVSGFFESIACAEVGAVDAFGIALTRFLERLL
jgi:hypothetical protein